MILKGRRKVSFNMKSEDMLDFRNVAKMVNGTISTHNANKNEIDYLFNYWKGVQPILFKENPTRDEINNIVVVNHAQRITRTIVGYFLGTPVQFIQARDEYKGEIEELNRMLAYEDKSSGDKEIGENQSVCGVGYRLIYTDGMYGDEIPFEDKSLDPSMTYVVYENDIAEKPLAGVHFYVLLNEKSEPIGRHYYIYTEHGVYEAEAKGDGLFTDDTPFTFVPYMVGGVPIIEYPNNQSRTGDWELVIGIMDSINKLLSGRLDDVQQIVQSLLVFVNAEVDGEMYDEMRRKGIVLLKNLSNGQTSIESITNPLDQNGMNIFAKELESTLDTLVGIPSRDNRGGGGGDTGQAVELRDGWADLEIVARNKESVFKRSEKLALKIILTILSNNNALKLSLRDIDIKFSRNKNHNLLVKTQSYETLINTRTIAPSDALSIVDLVSDVNEYASRGQSYWDAKNAEEQEQLKEQAKEQTPVVPKD